MQYVQNPPNPWLTHSVEWLGEPPETKLDVFEETQTRKIITHNDSPDVGFDYTVNCYRGCIHGCTYCFSRPTHEYLGYGAGTDFDRKIVVKVNAPALLREELMKPSWKGDEIVFSFTSDPYIPLEANYKLTRQCLKICAEFRQPVGVITKSALIRRDIDVLQQLTKDARVGVFFTIARWRGQLSRMRRCRKRAFMRWPTLPPRASLSESGSRRLSPGLAASYRYY
jgi:DNA repair photolyase